MYHEERAPCYAHPADLVVQLVVEAQGVPDLQQGILEWVTNWKARGWKTADKKPVKNQDLWQALDALAGMHELEWHWVKGHSGNVGNERVDALANRAIDALVG